MGYCIFTRIATRFPTEESREMFQQWIRESQNDVDTRWPILESCKWDTFEKDLKTMSDKFPKLIFLALYTGDSMELSYYVVNNGKLIKHYDELEMGSDIVEQGALIEREDDDDNFNQEVGSTHDLALQRAIKEFGYEDISNIFPSANTSENSSKGDGGENESYKKAVAPAIAKKEGEGDVEI
jgi:hypothetical protein